MTRTVMDVDRDLLARAKALLGAPSMTATINEALRRVVAGQALERVLDYFSDLDDDQTKALTDARNQW